MNMNNSPRSQIDEIISKVVGGETKHSIIKQKDVANRVNKLIDPNDEAPSLMSYASMMQIRNYVGKYLARKYDPETKAKEQLSGQRDMLCGELQSMYPVKRVEFDSQSAYVALDLLTIDEIRLLANKCFKIGDAYSVQGDLLLSYANSKTEVK